MARRSRRPGAGLARKSQAAPGGGVSTPVATPQAQWYRIDIPALQGQMPYQLESAFLEQLPEAGRTYDMLPIRSEPRPLDDGNHLSYAIQWFTFAAVLGFGYIMFVRQRTRLAAKPMQPSASTLPTTELEEPILAGDKAHPVH